MPARLFVGIRFDSQTLARLSSVAQRLRSAGVSGRYVDSQDLHVTVAFLGNVSDARYDLVANLLVERAAGKGAIPLRFDRLGAFPNTARPRVMWIGSRRPDPQFGHVGSAVREAYTGAGFAFRDDLQLHVTLCRPEEGSRVPRIRFAPISALATSLCLIESTRRQPRYRTVLEAPLI